MTSMKDTSYLWGVLAVFIGHAAQLVASGVTTLSFRTFRQASVPGKAQQTYKEPLGCEGIADCQRGSVKRLCALICSVDRTGEESF